jgi:hypothetical protein
MLAERLRYEAYARISARAFDALAAAAVPFIVLRGAALAEAAYPATTLRHSHDVDLLIRPNDVGRATDALRQAFFVDGTPYDETGPLGCSIRPGCRWRCTTGCFAPRTTRHRSTTCGRVRSATPAPAAR